jgi:hypothetical protein
MVRSMVGEEQFTEEDYSEEKVGGRQWSILWQGRTSTT